MEVNTIGQTVYEQLQEILNKCIELGWKVNNIDIYEECKIFDDYAIYYIENNGYKSCLYSYHHLFSKDSGLMEFVERDIKDMFFNRDQEELICIAFETMSMMTAEEKIEYFIRNATIPTK